MREFIPTRNQIWLFALNNCCYSIVLPELASTAFKRRHHVLGCGTLNAFGEGVLFAVPDALRNILNNTSVFGLGVMLVANFLIFTFKKKLKKLSDSKRGKYTYFFVFVAVVIAACLMKICAPYIMAILNRLTHILLYTGEK